MHEASLLNRGLACFLMELSKQNKTEQNTSFPKAQPLLSSFGSVSIHHFSVAIVPLEKIIVLSDLVLKSYLPFPAEF